MATPIPEDRLVELRAAGTEMAARGKFVDPRMCHRAQQIIRERGERWVAAILGRDVSRRSVGVPNMPHLRDGDLETIIAADADEDRYAIEHLDFAPPDNLD